MREKLRLVAVLCVAALAVVACTNKKDEDETTPQPSATAAVRAVAEFQLVGTITKAFSGAEPPIATGRDVQIFGPTSSPERTPVGGQPSEPGVLRIDVEDVNQELTDECGIADGEDARVYWTTDTSFDPDDVLDDVEDDIEGRVAGISGNVFRAAADGDDSCVLVAEQVGFEADRTSAPTRAPSVRRTSAPTKRPEATEEPTDEPDETKKPRKTPTDTATPTAQEQR